MLKYQIGCVLNPLPGDERFRGSLSIPYLSRRGNCISIKYRCCRPHKCKEIAGHAKYDKNRGDKSTLFNKAAYFSEGELIAIAEGEIDAIVATEILGIPTIGVPGATQWSGENADVWAASFKDFTKVLIFADGDDAGLKFARTVQSDLGAKASLVRCDEAEDVSSMIVHGKLTDLRKRCGLYDGDDIGQEVSEESSETQAELVADGVKA